MVDILVNGYKRLSACSVYSNRIVFDLIDVFSLSYRDRIVNDNRLDNGVALWIVGTDSSKLQHSGYVRQD